MQLARHETSTGAWPIWVIPETDFSLYTSPTDRKTRSDYGLFTVTGIKGKHRISIMTKLLKEAGLNTLTDQTYYARADKRDIYITHDDIFLTPKEQGNQHLRRNK